MSKFNTGSLPLGGILPVIIIIIIIIIGLIIIVTDIYEAYTVNIRSSEAPVRGGKSPPADNRTK